MDGEWEVVPIVLPMIMSFDGMAHFLRWNGTSTPDEVSAQKSAASRFDEPRKPSQNKEKCKGWGADPLYTLGDFCSTGYARPCKKVSSISMSFSMVFSMISRSPAFLAFSSSKLRWNDVIAGSSDLR